MSDSIRIIGRVVSVKSEHVGMHEEKHDRFTTWYDDWKTTLRYAGRQMTVDFHMGSGHNGAEPTVRSVLYSVAMDATSYEEARDFEDFARTFGYDGDSRKAEATYRACGRYADKLHQLLGEDYDKVTRYALEHLG